MQVSVETTSTLERRLTIGVPKERIEQKIQSRLKELARTAKVNGFRPGKIPLRVVEQKFGGQVRQEVIGELIETSFKEALEQEKLHPVGQPKIDLQSGLTDLTQDLAYTADFEVFPEITSVNIDGLNIEKPIVEVTQADIDNMLEKLRKQRQGWENIDSPAENDAQITVDFVGTVDGNAFQGNEAKGLHIVLGDERTNNILPGFSEAMIGVRKGDTREVDITFPAEHTNSEIAGKTVHFIVQILEVAKAKLPEINDEFIKSLGIATGELDALYKEVRDNMERELKFAVTARVKQQILEILLQNNPVDVPKAMIAQETQRMVQNMLEELQKSGMNSIQPEAAMFEERAARRVRLGMLMSELVRMNDIHVRADKVREMIETVASTYEEPEVVVKWYYAEPERLGQVESAVLEEQIVDWLVERAQVTEKSMSFDAVMEQHENK
ncbi:trigger factor [Beggiatoa leptomitoformis]|uniref:Trigger factor n=1 Tax=Beggiatoa leptomitoformis TaxID=288004 RepID=A0A2N9YF73_9GAMM|nr:trigger factor [Beggiatoa leptomitoformis]ALG68543.1 trigger factor [Beggiatoa leptomitoformis]AUI69113.1 trigger factor [Beggiatoa leptomitoformis]